MKTICLIGFWPDYDEHFFLGAKSENFQCIVYNLKRPGELPISFYLKPKPVFKQCLNSALNLLIDRHKDALFVFQAHKKLLNYLLRKELPSRCTVIYRDLIASQKIFSETLDAIKNKATLWSFDTSDCQSYGLNHYKQFIARLDDVSADIHTNKAIFIGRSKGRKEKIDNIVSELDKLGVCVDVQLFDDSLREKGLLTYRQYLARIAPAEYLIEVVQEGQRGMTLRSLEALIYQKKLITNNKAIVSEDFYHPSNIFITDKCFDSDSLREFICKPMQSLPEQVVEQYTSAYFLSQLLLDAANDTIS